MSKDLAIALSALAAVCFVAMVIIGSMRSSIEYVTGLVREYRKDRWADLERINETELLLRTLARECGYELRKPDKDLRWLKREKP